MRKYKKITITKEIEEIDYVKCDFCGKKTIGIRDWDCRHYYTNESEISIKIKQREGDDYPDGGFGTSYNIDICPECFKNKLIPWCLGQGAEIEKTEWETWA